MSDFDILGLKRIQNAFKYLAKKIHEKGLESHTKHDIKPPIILFYFYNNIRPKNKVATNSKIYHRMLVHSI